MTYYTVQLPSSDDLEEVTATLTAGNSQFACTFIWETDELSEDYHHWIVLIENLSSDTEETRSFTLYPNTWHFVGDTEYTVYIESELEEIGLSSLDDVAMSIGVNEDD